METDKVPFYSFWQMLLVFFGLGYEPSTLDYTIYNRDLIPSIPMLTFWQLVKF